MKRTLILALLALAVASSAHAEDKIFPYTPTQETLENGLQVILVPLPSDGLVSYWTIVRTGARDEVEKGRTGYAHFFEHMMFRGTEKYPAEVYNEKITSIGSDSNAFTSTDLTAYHNDFAARDLELVMDLESDRFKNLSYSKEVFQTEAGAVYGEYRKNRASPFFTAYEAVRAAAFDEHTYGHTAMGFVDDIKSMPEGFDYSRGFFNRFYRPENCILLIVGDLDPAKTLEMARRYYGDWKPGYQAPEVPAEPEQSGERKIDIPYEGSTLPILWLAYKFDAYDPKDPVQVAAFVLGELAFGQTSDLYRKLVLDEQTVVSLGGGPEPSRDPGLLDVIVRVKDPANVDSVLQSIDAATTSFRETPPPAEDVTAIRSRIKYGFLMNLDTPSNVAGALVQLLAVTGDLSSLETFYQTLAQVTPENVQQAAQRYFDTSRRTVAVLRGDQ